MLSFLYPTKTTTKMLRICSLSLLKYSYNRPRKSDDPKNSLKHHSLWTAPPKTPPPSYLLVSKCARPYSITKDDRPLRRYPIGKSDYKKIKEEKFFAFDKTLFLKHFFDDGAEVTLLLRPRRFAKTTTMSMLKYFSDMNEPQALREMMFKDTKIWSEQGGQYVRDHCGQYPVIFITFNECSQNSWLQMNDMLRELICKVYAQHRYVYDEPGFLTEQEKKQFGLILDQNPSGKYQAAIKTLSELLHRYHNKKVIILIDEYDKPVNHAYIHNFSTEVIGFMSVAFAGALKDNPHLYKGLMTGVLRIAKAGYLSGLNNLKVHSLLEPTSPYSTDIGIVHDEAIEALTYEGLEDKIDAVEKYYNGYTVGTDPKQRLFNSWSVINYLNDKVLKPYWVETGSTNLLEEQLMRANKEVHVQMEELLVNGKEICVPVVEDVNFSSLKDGYDQIWSLLFFSGYITGRKVDVNEDKAMVRVPNEEILRELKKMYNRILQRLMTMTPESCIASLIQGDVMDFEKGLKQAALKTFSFYDVDKSDQEVAYHMWVLGFIEPLRSLGYTIKSNREAGGGRYDILLNPNVPNDRQYSVILEFKAPTVNTKEEKEIMKILNRSAADALQQIKDKKYHVEANSKKILSLGIALHKKYVSIDHLKEN